MSSLRSRDSINLASSDSCFVHQLLPLYNDNIQQRKPEKFLAVISSTESNIQLFDTRTLQSQGKWTLAPSDSADNTSRLGDDKGHNHHSSGMIREVVQVDPQTVISANSDGTLAIFDIRQSGNKGPVSVYREPGGRSAFTCISVDSSGQKLAVGTEKFSAEFGAKVLFWDPRMMDEPLPEQLKESFGDDLTAVRFHPVRDNILLTGSTDGLACVFDLNELYSDSSDLSSSNSCLTDKDEIEISETEDSSDKEDDALTAVLNSGSSVSRLGFFGPTGDYVYLMTHIETFSVWSLNTGEIVKDFGDIRQPGLLDYMIDCSYLDFDRRMLLMLGGTFGGRLQLLNVTLDGLQPIGSSATEGQSHDGLIRSALWWPSLDSNGNCDSWGHLITGGEDSRIISWTLP